MITWPLGQHAPARQACPVGQQTPGGPPQTGWPGGQTVVQTPFCSAWPAGQGWQTPLTQLPLGQQAFDGPHGDWPNGQTGGVWHTPLTQLPVGQHAPVGPQGA